jgi:MFS family permease
MLAATFVIWRFVPESPVRTPGRINWTAAALMSVGISTVLIGVSKAPTWGWGSQRTLSLLAVGLALCAVWVWVEAHSDQPLIDMTMMRARGVWTANVTAVLLGGGLYTYFFVIPQFLQQPKSTGYGFGESIIMSGVVLVPVTIGMLIMGSSAGVVARRFGSRAAVIVGTALCSAGVVILTFQHNSPLDVAVCNAFFGVGNGLAYAGLGIIIVESVSPEQTGAAGGMNTVSRMIGGAVGGQIAATFLAGGGVIAGHPAIQSFVHVWTTQAVFLAAAAAAGFLIPRRRPYAPPRLEADPVRA